MSTTVREEGALAGPSAPAWRHLPFYEHTTVRDVSDFAKSPAALRASNEISAITATSADISISTSTQSTSSYQPNTKPEVIVLAGETNGQIKVLDGQTYAVLGFWQAFHEDTSLGAVGKGRVTHISCSTSGHAVTLGEDAGSRFPVIRIWDLLQAAQKEDNSWAPRLLSEAKVQHGSRPHPVAALSHTPSLSFLSIGLADGSVLLLRDLNEALKVPSKSSEVSFKNAAVSLPKFKVAFQPSTKSGEGVQEPVTGLGFAEQLPREAFITSDRSHKELGIDRRTSTSRRAPVAAGRGDIHGAARSDHSRTNGTSPQTIYLFIVTLSRILRYTVFGKGAGSPATVVDDVGCGLGCAEMVQIPMTSPLARKMIIAREEAIYVVGADGREVCLAYEGPKSLIRLATTHLVIVSPPMSATATSTSATIRQHVAQKDRLGRSSPALNGRRQSEVAKVTVFDLDNKLVAYSGTFDGGVRDAWADVNGEICVLGDDGGLTILKEKPLRAKLDILFRKSLYLLAVNVTKSHAARTFDSSPETVAHVKPLLADIFRKYGDHLYAKGDFEGAMNQFVKTIGITQPSYVIRKYLDAQRIKNLTMYLQELHARGLANSDHTTLLLNCYTKLKDVASLDRFIKRPLDTIRADVESPEVPHGDDDLDGQVEKEELPFDLETAIRVCRQAGYYEHAAYLAKRYGQHNEYMRIQIDDTADFEDALAHVRSLGPEEAERNLVQYGKAMLNNLPEKTTDVLIELCSGAFKPTPLAVGTGIEAKSQNKSAAAAYLSYLQVGAFSRSNVTPSGTATPKSKDNTSSAEGNVNRAEDRDETALRENLARVEGTENGMSEYPVPSPRLFFAHFIRHPRQFKRFLETVALARWGQSVNVDALHHTQDPMALRDLKAPDAPIQTMNGRERGDADRKLMGLDIELGDGEDSYETAERRDQCFIWNTLFELYLRESRSSPRRDGLAEEESQLHKRRSVSALEPQLDGAQRAGHRERALRLLEQHDSLPYDITQALVLCSHEGFTEGMIVLYERMGMYEDVLRFYMDASLAYGAGEADVRRHVTLADDPSCKVMDFLRRYGPHQPHLYPLTLRFLVSSEAILSKHREDVETVLDHIEENQLMGPLEIVQALSRTSVASVGLVRQHLTRAILSQKEDIEADRRLIDSYRSETSKKLAEVDELTDTAAPRVFQHTKCEACGGSLDLPSVHFMCRHSFHQRCLVADGEGGQNEGECPTCARSHGVIREIRRNNEVFADRHDLFLNEVEEAEDGFEVIASMFSKGLLGPLQLGGLGT